MSMARPHVQKAQPGSKAYRELLRTRSVQTTVIRRSTPLRVALSTVAIVEGHGGWIEPVDQPVATSDERSWRAMLDLFDEGFN